MAVDRRSGFWSAHCNRAGRSVLSHFHSSPFQLLPVRRSLLQSSKAELAERSTIVVACSLAMMAALILGVGIPNHMVLRHVVQTLPIWGVVILGARRSRLAGWVGLRRHAHGCTGVLPEELNLALRLDL
jgi:hypothetical protein